MFKAEQFRAKAAQSAESMKNTDIPSEVSKFHQSMESFSQLAQNEDWLADNYDKMLHSQDLAIQDLASEDLASQNLASQDAVVGTPLDRKAVAKSEEKILRCLGAAVIMQWNTIPAKLQRELFDTAGSLGDLPQTTELRGQIARFLHNHKNAERVGGDFES